MADDKKHDVSVIDPKILEYLASPEASRVATASPEFEDKPTVEQIIAGIPPTPKKGDVISLKEAAGAMARLMNGSSEVLKLFRFYWDNPDKKYTLKVSLVIAIDEAEARKLFQENEEELENQVRDAMKDMPPAKMEEMVKKIRTKDGLKVREFPLRKGVIS
jgi:hypothetical protein